MAEPPGSVVTRIERDQVRELAAHRHHGLVAEERTRAVAGGVDEGLLAQRSEIRRAVELDDLDLAAAVPDAAYTPTALAESQKA